MRTEWSQSSIQSALSVKDQPTRCMEASPNRSMSCKIMGTLDVRPRSCIVLLRLHALSTSSLCHSWYTDRSRLAPSCARKTKTTGKEGGQRFEECARGYRCGWPPWCARVRPECRSGALALRRPPLASTASCWGTSGAWGMARPCSRSRSAWSCRRDPGTRGCLAAKMRSGGLQAWSPNRTERVSSLTRPPCGRVAAPVAGVAGLPLTRGFVTIVIGGCIAPPLL